MPAQDATVAPTVAPTDDATDAPTDAATDAATSDADVDLLVARTRFGADGLVPAIAQQWDTREVLMLAWMDEAALRETLTTGRGVYYSRSRGGRWAKGDTSGHVQAVREVRLDCDGDTVLLLVEQAGGACHTGDRTCFDADRTVVSGGQE